MNDVAKSIDSTNRMVDIKYINCTPEIPVNPPKGDHSYINIQYFLILVIISLLA